MSLVEERWTSAVLPFRTPKTEMIRGMPARFCWKFGPRREEATGESPWQ